MKTKRLPDDDFREDFDNVDYTDMKISDLLKTKKEKIIYEYDFGDSWEHDMVLEKILLIDDKIDALPTLYKRQNEMSPGRYECDLGLY